MAPRRAKAQTGHDSDSTLPAWLTPGFDLFMSFSRRFCDAKTVCVCVFMCVCGHGWAQIDWKEWVMFYMHFEKIGENRFRHCATLNDLAMVCEEVTGPSVFPPGPDHTSLNASDRPCPKWTRHCLPKWIRVSLLHIRVGVLVPSSCVLVHPLRVRRCTNRVCRNTPARFSCHPHTAYSLPTFPTFVHA